MNKRQKLKEILTPIIKQIIKENKTKLTKQLKAELTRISNLPKSQIIKLLKQMKADNKISDYGIFKDGVNIYDDTGSVVFEINF